MGDPLVSVVMPVHNAERFLDESVSSVLAQTMTDLELLLVDDHSRDASAAKIGAWANRDPRVRALQSTELGAAAARNTALDAARGRYVAFLDADDAWLPNKLERQLHFMQERDAYFSFTAYEKVDIAGRGNGRVVRAPLSRDYAGLLKGCVIGCSTVVIDTLCTGRVRMPPMKRSQDYALWLDLLKRFGPAHGLDEPLTRYREYAGSLSANKFGKLQAAWRIYREREGFSRWRSACLLACYVAHGLRKRAV